MIGTSGRAHYNRDMQGNLQLNYETDLLYTDHKIPVAGAIFIIVDSTKPLDHQGIILR